MKLLYQVEVRFYFLFLGYMVIQNRVTILVCSFEIKMFLDQITFNGKKLDCLFHKQVLYAG